MAREFSNDSLHSSSSKFPYSFGIMSHDIPSYSGYSSSSQLHGKRKASESIYHQRAKQQITEARISSSMQRLNLSGHSIPQSNRASDEGFFEDVVDVFDLDVDVDDEDDLDLTDTDVKDINQVRNLRQFSLDSSIKEKLGKKQINQNLLPEEIFKAINASCMALVPYTPPISATLKFHTESATNEKKDSVASITKGLTPLATENNEEMRVDREEEHDNAMMMY